MTARSAPASRDELLRRAHALAGLGLGEIAAQVGAAVPADRRRAKGWAGALVEAALGAPGGSRPEPDFVHLGVELKTVPVGTDGRPLESTHVCTAPLTGTEGASWETSLVRRKLACVLWVPVLAPRGVAPAAIRVGAPLLWAPDPDQARALRCDWEELMEFIALGRVDEITGDIGMVLQLRPKAANGRSATAAHDAAGNAVAVLPRGFYLRARFTAEILATGRR
ncbi:MAG: DNA mismatch repair endonuclease MutH [Gammaproteobacteria bacterium]